MKQVCALRAKLFFVVLLLAGLTGCTSVDSQQNNNPLKNIFTPYSNGQSLFNRQKTDKNRFFATNVNATGGGNAAEVRGTGKFVGDVPKYIPDMTFSGEDGITLNLLNVPIAEAIKTVLGDILGLNYTVGGDVTGNITIQTTNPVPKARLASIFENIIKASGYGIVERDGTFIVQSSVASRRAARLTKRSSRKPSVGQQIRIIPLEYINAKKMNDLLAPISETGLDIAGR